MSSTAVVNHPLDAHLSSIACGIVEALKTFGPSAKRLKKSDLLGEVYLKLRAKSGSADPTASWVFTYAKRAAIDQIHKELGHRRVGPRGNQVWMKDDRVVCQTDMEEHDDADAD